MHTLHTRAAQIYQWWASEGVDPSEEERPNVVQNPSLWRRGWCPLLQGIARLCCDSRKLVRTAAISCLQRSLLVHDLQSLTAGEWESCFNTVLFPLLAKLLEPHRPEAFSRNQSSWEETRTRAATLLSKVFLQHLGPLLQLPTFTALWLTLLDFMDKFMHVEHSDQLAESVPEMIKNMLLVMETAGVFGTSSEGDQGSLPLTPHSSPMGSQLWNLTCDRIDVFLPNLRQDITRNKTPVVRHPPVPSPVDPALTSETNSDSPSTEALNSDGFVVMEQVVATDVESGVIQTATSDRSSVDSGEQPPASLSIVVETNRRQSVETVPVQETINEPVPDDKSPMKFVAPSVFSVWNVPDPSDAGSLFFHNLTPAPVDDVAVSQQPTEQTDNLHVMPISLIPEDGSAVPIVPSITAMALEQEQDKTVCLI